MFSSKSNIIYFTILFVAYFNLFKVNAEETNDTDQLTEDENVYVLNQKNFDKFVNENDISVVFFYAPWCGHCTNMKPYYHKAAKLFKDEIIKTDKKVYFAKVDATIEKELGSKHGINAYPTLKIFRKGVAYKYSGPRQDETKIGEYMAEQASYKWKPPVNRVVDLSNSNFTAWVEKYSLSLVEFYSPGCGYCQQLAPNYEEAAEELFKEEEPIMLAKINGVEEKELSEKFKITGYPTLYYYRYGRQYEYKGGREAQDIKNYMIKLRNMKSKEVNTFKSFRYHVQKPSDIYVLGLFQDSKQPLFKAYSDLFASKYSEDLHLYHTFNISDVNMFLNPEEIKPPSIIVYYQNDMLTAKHPKYKVYRKNTETSLEDLEHFIFNTSVPTVAFMNPKTYEFIYKNIYPICFVLHEVDIEMKSHLHYIRDRVHVLSKTFKDIKFVIANASENTDFVLRHDLDKLDNDIKFICMKDKHRSYILREIDDDFDVDEAKEFVKKFSAGKLKWEIKSEIAPENNDKRQVKILVGKTFEKFIADQKKDIVLGLYDVGVVGEVGKSEKFEAFLNSAANKYAKNDKLVFAKMNVRFNDYPEAFKIGTGFNKLYYVPFKNKSNPIVLEGMGLTEKDYNTFIQDNLAKYSGNENSKNEIKKPQEQQKTLDDEIEKKKFAEELLKNKEKAKKVEIKREL